MQATPTAIMAGIGNASKYGILVRQGDALERLAKVTRISFDKTGTLTLGKPAVTKIVSLTKRFNEKELLEIAASAEIQSEHPLGKAIVAEYCNQSGNAPLAPDEFTMMPGRGVYAEIEGMKVYVGNETLILKQSIHIGEEIKKQINSVKEDGGTIIYLTSESEMLGYIELSDTLRKDAGETIKSIEETGTKTLLLTGDTRASARRIAASAHIDDFRSECLPEDKLRIIEDFQKDNEAICMVGDGVNDAAALKAAQVGIAMGGIGSDIAIEAADIALVGDDIKEIPHLLKLSKRMMRTININLAASMTLNFIAIILAITGVLGPVIGALVHNVGSVAVIINSSLLLKWRDKK